MSIQQNIASDVYKMADAAQTPQQIKDLQGLLTRSVQDGALPSYIGVPILSNLNQRLQQVGNQGIAQAPQQPPIAQQILQQAQQPEPTPQPTPQPAMQPAPQPAQQAQGLNSLQSNLPVEGMYDGGIVALAGGGDIDDDEDDERNEEAEYMQALQQAQETSNLAAEITPQGIASALPRKEKEFINRTPDVEKGIHLANTVNLGGNGIDEIISQAAKGKNLPPELMRNIAIAESGLDPNAANKRSSAKGLYQFIDKTWAGMGGKEGEQFDPTRNAELGAAFTRKNAEYLKSALGRDPTYGEVYAAHFFGPGTARQLAMADPGMGIDAALGNRANQVISANPHLRGKTVGDVFSGLSNKAGEGIVALAKGGEVQHFLTGDQVKLLNTPYSDLPEVSAEPSVEQPRYSVGVGDSDKTGFTSWQTPEGAYWGVRRQRTLPPNTTIATPSPVNQGIAESSDQAIRDENAPYSDQITGQDFSGMNGPEGAAVVSAGKPLPATGIAESSDQAIRDSNVQSNAKAQADALSALKLGPNSYAPVNQQRSAFDEFMEQMRQERGEIKQQKEEDKYMALLTAGLGMMGGTSPYAMANIGQGALAGVANYGQSSRQRAAELAALNKGLISAQRYKELGDIAKQNQLSNEAYRKESLGLKGRELDISEASKSEMAGLRAEELSRKTDADLQTMLGREQENARKTIKDQWSDIRQMRDPKGYEAAIASVENNPKIKQIQRIIDARYRDRYKDSYPELYNDQATPPPANRPPLSSFNK